MPTNPLITVIVLNWNGEKIFPACLESLAKLEYAPVEVLFVDNGSTDRSVEIARGFPGVKIIEYAENLGYAGGNNRTLAAALGSQSKYVCFLNNDVMVSPNWLNDPIAFLERDDKVGVVACRNMNYFEKEIIDGLYHYLGRFFTILRYGRGEPYRESPLYNEPGYVMSALGSSAIYRTDLVKAMGGFDESFIAYYEEVDLCMRINNSGRRCLYVPTSVVYHMDQASWGKNSDRSYYLSERNRLFFLKKNFPPRMLHRYRHLMLLEDLRSIKGCLTGHNKPGLFLKARLDAIKGLRNYREPAGGTVDEAYISKLIALKKIPL